MNEHWRQRLTPYDMELQIMIDSLLGIESEISDSEDCYTIVAYFGSHDNDQYLQAVRDAIEGRAGERLVGIVTDPDEKTIVVRVKYAEQQYPEIMYCPFEKKPNPEVGEERIMQGNVHRVMKVERENIDKLFEFVGNGELELREPAVFHFLNADRSVFNHVPEGHYLVYYRDGLFGIASENEFERK